MLSTALKSYWGADYDRGLIMKDWQEWFRHNGGSLVGLDGVTFCEPDSYRITVEELYQAFKARLEFETREN